MKIKILYEDSNILAIDKPSGIMVHPDERSKAKTILDIFIKKYPKLEIVHRLDKDTSGVLLLAKNKKAHEFLKLQFQARTIKKTYHTIVSGTFRDERGVIDRPIGRSPSDFRRYSASRGARGEMREAITRYKVLNRFKSPSRVISSRFTRQNPTGSDTTHKSHGTATPNFTYLEVYPKTGRTHQIRVHMKAIDHPVVGDSLYNPKGPCPKDIKRMALHALSIEFKNLKGDTIKVTSPLPKELKIT